MKIAISVPKANDLIAAYNNFVGKQAPTIEQLLLYAQWSRFDPRLLEILAKYFSDNFFKINPFDFNTLCKKSCWPQTSGVILNHARLLVPDKELFDHWLAICMHQIPPGTGELFFIGLFDFNMKKILRIISRPSRLFLQWGYLHDEVVLNKANLINRTTLSKSSRTKILKALLRQKKPVSVERYRRLLNYQISVRQAQRDLKSFTSKSE